MSTGRFFLWFFGLWVVGGFGYVWLMLGLGDYEGCGEDSPAAQLARGLSDDQLSHLYTRMSELSKEDFNPPWNDYQFEEIPAEFAFLDAEIIKPHEGAIILEGCFDHSVALAFRGIGDPALPSNQSSAEIVLSYGEFPVRSEVVWNE